MAQVTMTATEYGRLEAMANKFDELLQAIINGFHVEYKEGSWKSVQVKAEPDYGEEVQSQIAFEIASQCANNPDIMKHLVEEDEYIYDLWNVEICASRWENRLYEGQVDMRKICPAFDEAWTNEVERVAQAATEPTQVKEEEEFEG